MAMFLTYANPLYTDSNFAIGIDFDQIRMLDTIAIYTNKDGDAGGREQSWEQDASGNWYTLKYNWPLNVDFAIFPIVNTSVGIDVLVSKTKSITIWPNPSQDGDVNINIPFSEIKSLQVYSSNLQLLKSEIIGLGIENTHVRFDSCVKGVYFIRIVSHEIMNVQKVVIE